VSLGSGGPKRGNRRTLSPFGCISIQSNFLSRHSRGNVFRMSVRIKWAQNHASIFSVTVKIGPELNRAKIGFGWLELASVGLCPYYLAQQLKGHARGHTNCNERRSPIFGLSRAPQVLSGWLRVSSAICENAKRRPPPTLTLQRDPVGVL